MNPPSPMEPTAPRETAAEIEQAAACWVARIDRATLSVDEHDELQRWTAADPRRAGAFARAMALNLYLDRAAALGPGVSAQAEPNQAPTRRRAMAVAASVAVAGGLGILTWCRTGTAPSSSSIATIKGAVRKVALREGSQLTLNTMTQVRPAFSADQRRVDLLQGEALFDVTSDPARPFIVYAGDLRVRAVGTNFLVRRTGPEAIRLLVTEGVVEVSRRDDVLGQVHAGIQFTVQAAAPPIVTTLSAAQISGALAWRDGLIDLQGLTLAEAAAEFSRYSDLKIEVGDPSIADQHITGLYATDNPERFAHDVALSLGLRTTRQGNILVLTKS